MSVPVWKQLMIWQVKWLKKLTWRMRVSFKAWIKYFECVRCKRSSSFSLFWRFYTHKVRQWTLAHFKPAVSKEGKKVHFENLQGCLIEEFSIFYLPLASFIHCSSTGFIFWALLGVMSSFSNLRNFTEVCLYFCALYNIFYLKKTLKLF